MPASPARQVAYEVVRRASDGAYADRVLRAGAQRAGLAGPDRAFAQRLAYGVVQRRRTLDHVIARLSARPLDRLDPAVLDALRVGIFQLVWMDSVPDHAAVTETVELTKQAARGATGFVNAVMRRAAREAPAAVAALRDATPAEAAIKHSHPDWIVELWWNMLGREETLALLERDNEPAEDALRVNTLVAVVDDVVAVTEAHPAPELPEGLVLDTPFDIEGSELFAAGAITPQSRASMLVARTLDPQPGEAVLDMCAAPGTKTTHIAALTDDRAEVTAVERSPARAEALRANLERMRVYSVDVVVEDARTVTGAFDRILLDAPCSNLGTLAGRPDARWRRDPAQLDELARLQAELLETAARVTRPGGTLVYSVCTISPRESTDQLMRLEESHPELRVARTRQTLPNRDGTDGFFIARLEKTT
jgi:16S rRNA (cytosine967-C5)-methyltransferase